jgi:hypothetical protein
MNDKLILKLELIHSKIGYILACLSSYSSLDLSKRIIEINEHIELINKTFKEQKNYIDVRNVIKLREQLKELKTRLNNDDEVSLQGHKIACLLFEVSMEIKMLILDIDASYDDIIEYLSLASQYLYDCGRIINIEILCFENKLL